MTLVLERAHINLIARNSLNEYPREACGILIGRMKQDIKVVKRVFKTHNILESASRYAIDPKEQLEAFKLADDLSMDVVGFYHSHPYWRPYPSATDHSLAFYEGLSYAIYSLVTKSLASYIWNGKSFDREEVHIIDD